jgi:hypothetical protein
VLRFVQRSRAIASSLVKHYGKMPVATSETRLRLRQAVEQGKGLSRVTCFLKQECITNKQFSVPWPPLHSAPVYGTYLLPAPGLPQVVTVKVVALDKGRMLIDAGRKLTLCRRCIVG